MGFCRRCGDIVVGTRCKCGGTAVAPVVQWANSKGDTTDRWSQIYVSRERSPTRPSPQVGAASTSFHTAAQSSSANVATDKTSFVGSIHRFPRHGSFPSSDSPTSSRTDVVSHVSSVTPPLEPLNSTPTLPSTFSVETDLIQALDTPDLSNAYGSILQPKETLATYSCAVCSTEFQPDATIYPDPLSPLSYDRFLCGDCFGTNGGSKGNCPTCHRPVLILKSEGGFVEASGRVWHKRCFTCVGCRKNIGETPMVDLLGQPSCPNCFDNCLNRNTTPQRSYESRIINKADKRLSDAALVDRSCREGPAVDEAQQRLDFTRSRHGSPVLEELTQRLNAVLNRTPRDTHASMTPPSRGVRSDNRDNCTIYRTPGKIMATTLPSSNQSSDAYDMISRNNDADADSRTSTPSRRIHPSFVMPEHDHTSSSGRPSSAAIEEMKRRFMKDAPTSPASLIESSPSPDSLSRSLNMISATSTPSRIPKMCRTSGSPALRHATSTSSLQSSRTSLIPPTPDLIMDISDTIAQDSRPASSSSQVNLGGTTTVGNEHASHVNPSHEHGSSLVRAATPKARDSLDRLSIPTATLSPGSLCAKCGGSLFAKGGSGRFVTVPELSTTGPPKTYHSECFRCMMCDGPFKESSNGQAMFVRGEGGACHMECAPPERTHVKSTVVSSPIKSAFSDPPLTPPLLPVTNTIQTAPPPKIATTGTSHIQLKESPGGKANVYSSRYERPPPSAPAVSAPYSRFGSSAACPGCLKIVSPMEFGVVPGPQGSRWHAICLVCGGKGASKTRREKSQPGCGKKLDSAAKRDAEGGVWCRECLLLLPSHLRNPQVDSAAKPLLPSFTGRGTGGPFVTPQYTGITTIARQFTGRGVDASLIRQLTGGSVSPSRQRAVSPTKQLGLATPRPRPKSVIGMRSGKSVDEGRGMFLVRQMTGGGGSFGI